MSKKNDGGPAFPRPMGHNHPDAESEMSSESQRGMTMRDWFAGQTVEGYYAMMSRPDFDIAESKLSDIATRAFRQSDAMLKAREAE